MYKLKGIASVVGEVETVGANNFRKRELVVLVENERDHKWDDYIKFEATQDKCDILNPIEVGMPVDITFVVGGRKFEKEGKVSYFNSLKIISIDFETKAGKKLTATPEVAAPKQPMSAKDIGNGPADDEGDDLPF
jgi:hypothetical protein